MFLHIIKSSFDVKVESKFQLHQLQSMTTCGPSDHHYWFSLSASFTGLCCFNTPSKFHLGPLALATFCLESSFPGYLHGSSLSYLQILTKHHLFDNHQKNITYPITSTSHSVFPFPCSSLRASLVAQMVKNPPAMWETWV